VNSTPVLVKDGVNLGYINLPATQGGGAPYSTFLTQKAARPAVLFVGSNDGMLHAFKDTRGADVDTDGREIFAYVPRAVYANLHKLADKNYGTSALYHQYFVDGPLVETDAYIPAPGETAPSWRNYLVGTLGAGGRAVFAVDVTNSDSLGASSIRWEISNTNYPDLGHIIAPVQVGVLPNGEWVAIFGNGRFSDAGNAVLFVVNLSTGLAQTLTVDPTGSSGLGVLDWFVTAVARSQCFMLATTKASSGAWNTAPRRRVGLLCRAERLSSQPRAPVVHRSRSPRALSCSTPLVAGVW